MATRAQIVEKLANRRLAKHYLPNLSRQQIRAAAQELTNPEWDAIIRAIRERDAKVGGLVLAKRVEEHLRGLAKEDIENRLGGNDTLSISELEDLF